MFDVDIALFPCFQFFAPPLFVSVICFRYLSLSLAPFVVQFICYCCHTTIDEKLILSFQLCMPNRYHDMKKCTWSSCTHYCHSWTLFIIKLLFVIYTYVCTCFGQVRQLGLGMREPPLEAVCGGRLVDGHKKKWEREKIGTSSEYLITII